MNLQKRGCFIKMKKSNLMIEMILYAQTISVFIGYPPLKKYLFLNADILLSAKTRYNDMVNKSI